MHLTHSSHCDTSCIQAGVLRLNQDSLLTKEKRKHFIKSQGATIIAPSFKSKNRKHWMKSHFHSTEVLQFCSQRWILISVFEMVKLLTWMAPPDQSSRSNPSEWAQCVIPPRAGRPWRRVEGQSRMSSWPLAYGPRPITGLGRLQMGLSQAWDGSRRAYHRPGKPPEGPITGLGRLQKGLSQAWDG